MSTITLTLSGRSSQLQAEYFPAIDLSDGNYVCGLIDFQAFNSIPNVDETNNLFYCGFENLESEQFVPIADANITTNEINIDGPNNNSNNNDDNNDIERNRIIEVIPTKKRRIRRATPFDPFKQKQPLTITKIPTGSYELEHLSDCLKKLLHARFVALNLRANKNTLQCEIMCSQPIDFTKSNTIGSLLGFRCDQVLKENVVHESELPSDILKISVIRVECNIIKGSYLNSQPSHTIHEFSPKVPPGYKIIEVPQNVIYFPVTVKSIHTLNISIIDQQNNLVNFRGETITIRLHIKKAN